MTENRKLYRSNTEKIIAGVSGGLAHYFNIDPVIMRIAFVLLSFANGLGILGYLILWIVVPKKQGTTSEIDRSHKIKEFTSEVNDHIKNVAEEIKSEHPTQRRNIFGIILVVIGAIFLMNQVYPVRFFAWKFIWPLLLILLGIYVISRNTRK